MLRAIHFSLSLARFLPVHSSWVSPQITMTITSSVHPFVMNIGCVFSSCLLVSEFDWQQLAGWAQTGEGRTKQTDVLQTIRQTMGSLQWNGKNMPKTGRAQESCLFTVWSAVADFYPYIYAVFGQTSSAQWLHLAQRSRLYFGIQEKFLQVLTEIEWVMFIFFNQIYRKTPLLES